MKYFSTVQTVQPLNHESHSIQNHLQMAWNWNCAMEKNDEMHTLTTAAETTTKQTKINHILMLCVIRQSQKLITIVLARWIRLKSCHEQPLLFNVGCLCQCAMCARARVWKHKKSGCSWYRSIWNFSLTHSQFQHQDNGLQILTYRFFAGK